MQVKCKCHGFKIDRESAFKVNINNKNEYYCNENEYKKIQEEKQNRTNTINLINDIFGYIITNTFLFKELTELAKVYTYTKIHCYINDNKNNLCKFMNKDFTNEFGKIKYFTAILKNNLRDYKIPQQEINKEISSEVVINKYAPKERKKNLTDFINELE